MPTVAAELLAGRVLAAAPGTRHRRAQGPSAFPAEPCSINVLVAAARADHTSRSSAHLPTESSGGLAQHARPTSASHAKQHPCSSSEARVALAGKAHQA